jgi:hypothetical protein
VIVNGNGPPVTMQIHGDPLRGSPVEPGVELLGCSDRPGRID